MNQHFGEIISLIVAVSWTLTALSFEYASKKVGSVGNVSLYDPCFQCVFRIYRKQTHLSQRQSVEHPSHTFLSRHGG